MEVSGAKRAILIAGPTASGKSALATTLAERHGGVVVNADSMQVYADLAILTARPSRGDLDRVPHRLFGHVDAAEAYSVGRWLLDLRAVLQDAAAKGRRPVIVGGTGLYLAAMTRGLSDMPAVPADIRDRLRREATLLPAATLHARLAALDPAAAARLRPSDPQRILRALEILETTGRSLLWFQERRGPAVLPPAMIVGVFLELPRVTLHERIDRRFDDMLRQGALDEVAALARRSLDPALPAMRALGVPDLQHALENPEALPAAVVAAKRASRLYAKRQVTYARHQLPNLTWVTPDQAMQVIERQL